MPTQYHEAPEVREMAESLIPQYHRHLIDTEGVRIEYIFRNDVPKKNGAQVWGTARKITSLAAFLADQEADEEESGKPFFVLCISYPIWCDMTTAQKEALVDHELSHCWAKWDDEKEKTVLTILPHDLEEFHAVVARHGYWRSSVQRFVEAAER